MRPGPEGHPRPPRDLEFQGVHGWALGHDRVPLQTLGETSSRLGPKAAPRKYKWPCGWHFPSPGDSAAETEALARQRSTRPGFPLLRLSDPGRQVRAPTSAPGLPFFRVELYSTTERDASISDAKWVFLSLRPSAGRASGVQPFFCPISFPERCPKHACRSRHPCKTSLAWLRREERDRDGGRQRRRDTERQRENPGALISILHQLWVRALKIPSRTLRAPWKTLLPSTS